MVQVTSMRAEQKEETSVQYIKGPENKTKLQLQTLWVALKRKQGECECSRHLITYWNMKYEGMNCYCVWDSLWNASAKKKGIDEASAAKSWKLFNLGWSSLLCCPSVCVFEILIIKTPHWPENFKKRLSLHKCVSDSARALNMQQGISFWRKCY